MSISELKEPVFSFKGISELMKAFADEYEAEQSNNGWTIINESGSNIPEHVEGVFYRIYPYGNTMVVATSAQSLSILFNKGMVTHFQLAKTLPPPIR